MIKYKFKVVRDEIATWKIVEDSSFRVNEIELTLEESITVLHARKLIEEANDILSRAVAASISKR